MKLLALNIPHMFYSTTTGLEGITGSPGSLISSVLPNILIIAGVIFFIMILFGGFSLIIGAGRESSPQSAAKAKSAVTFAVIGFLLVVSAYFILQIISTVIGVDLTNTNIN